MKEINTSYIEIKKSKFYGYLFYINNIEDINEILEKIKLDNKKAKHIVYAYKIGYIEKKHEDKEPSGSAATPILNLINIKQFNNILIIVVRYFGGVLLGKGLLTRTYRNVANELLKKDDINQFFQ